ncbi:MAG TPA: methionyl-tRNA formyltransferase [Burkholderiales bacterium]|nr:methionyl-tRNA formyltransferase [Burkholderiales bacterium]
MKLIFAGTPAFAATALEALLAAGHDIVLVLTRPDRPAGRGLAPQPGAVKQLALARGLPLAQPATLKDAAVELQLRAVDAEAMVVAAYGLILPPAVLAIPRRGCLNIHASLLPRWRGAAPIQRALLAGDAATGITIMQMDEGLDTGAILLQEKIAIGDDDTARTLHDRLAALGAQSIVRALAAFPAPRAQDDAQATYADKIRKEEAVIDWTQPAQRIARQVRAFNPAPAANTTLDGRRFKLWRAHQVAAAGAPGAVLAADAAGIVVACGDGALAVEELQREGGRALAAGAFLAGFELRPGARFGT